MKKQPSPLNQQLLEQEYGFLNDVVFADMCSVVMPPVRVQKAFSSFMSDYVKTFGKGFIPKAHAMVDTTRQLVAELINADSSEIGFTKNTCEGVSILANGYPFSAGDNVIIADIEHPSNALPWIHAQRFGVQLRVIENDTHEHPSVDDYLKLVDERTRIIAVSAAQFGSGYFIDLKRLGQECRKRNILFAVDGIQALGRVPIDVQAMHIDYLATGGNKGLLATLGAGFVYCSKEVVSSIVPPYVGYQSVMNETPPPSPLSQFDSVNWKPNAQRFESGNLNYSGIQAIGEAVSLLLEFGVNNIADWVLYLEKELRDRLASLSLDVITIEDPKRRSGTICINYPSELDQVLLDIFAESNIFATIRGGWLRLSLGLYNTLEDVEKIFEALKTFSTSQKI